VTRPTVTWQVKMAAAKHKLGYVVLEVKWTGQHTAATDN